MQGQRTVGITECPNSPRSTDVNARFAAPGGFPRPLAAKERVWKTPTGRANFKGFGNLRDDPDMPEEGADVLRLTTLRSDDQFNTTICSLDDRFRGVYGRGACC